MSSRRALLRRRLQILNATDPPFQVLDNYSTPGSPDAGWDRTYQVIGSTGNVYKVTIGRQQICACADYAKHGVKCKHILFLLINLYGFEENSAALLKTTFSAVDYQRLNEPQLPARIANHRARPGVDPEALWAWHAAKETRDYWRLVVQYRRDDFPATNPPIRTCGFCSEVLLVASRIKYCLFCRRAEHKVCYQYGLSTGLITCTHCGAPKAISNETKYWNVGRMCGMPIVRNT